MESEFGDVALSFGKLVLHCGSIFPREVLMCWFSWDLSCVTYHIPKIQSDGEGDATN